MLMKLKQKENIKVPEIRVGRGGRGGWGLGSLRSMAVLVGRAR